MSSCQSACTSLLLDVSKDPTPACKTCLESCPAQVAACKADLGM